MKEKEYNNGEITISWKPELCQHARVCVKLLPEVYHPNEKPWIKLENASSKELEHQVSKCPSGALSIKYKYNPMIEIKQEDNGKKGRFVIYEAGQFAGEMTYVWTGNSFIIIDHTEVDEAFSGKGYAKKLVTEAISFARQNGIKIMPLCPYAKSVFDKNPDLADIRV